MNLIEAITQNNFLKKLYPDGIKSLSINGLTTDFSSVYLDVRTQDTPSMFIGKYGEWQVDYDTVEFKLIGNFVSHVNISNWNNNFKESCSYEVSSNENGIFLKFWNEKQWSVELKMKTLTFQSCKTYMKVEEDYYPL